MDTEHTPATNRHESGPFAGIRRTCLLIWRFNQAEISRLSKLRRAYRGRRDALDLPVDAASMPVAECRLRFARWLVEHGRLSDDDGTGPRAPAAAREDATTKWPAAEAAPRAPRPGGQSASGGEGGELGAGRRLPPSGPWSRLRRSLTGMAGRGSRGARDVPRGGERGARRGGRGPRGVPGTPGPHGQPRLDLDARWYWSLLRHD